MKKLNLIILSFIMILALLSCQKKESIDDPKEFETGDIVEYNGVIYEYIDIWKDIQPLTGEKELEYVFEEEEDFKSYYNYYYYDMSDYKNQPNLRDEIRLLQGEKFDPYTFAEENNIGYNPTTAYATYIPLYFRSRDNTKAIFNGSFIIKGYTEDLPEEVVIPATIHGKGVNQIGFRAFENAPMKTLTFMSINNGMEYILIHPFAIYNCDNLVDIKFEREGLVMSMGISNCDNVECITRISPTMDCSLYNLPQLKELKQIDINLDIGPYYIYNNYGMGGLKKSFFYNCPKIESITGENGLYKTKITTLLNTFYFESPTFSIPIYVLNNYTAIIDDYVFSNSVHSKVTFMFTLMYNPDTLEAYIPFLNDGLEKEGSFIFNSRYQSKDAVTEDETGIYVNAIYQDESYNNKILFQRK